MLTAPYQICKDTDGNFHVGLPNGKPMGFQVDILTIKDIPVAHVVEAIKGTQDEANSILSHYL